MANTKVANRRLTMNKLYDLLFFLTFFLLDMLYSNIRLLSGGLELPKSLNCNLVKSVSTCQLICSTSSIRL